MSRTQLKHFALTGLLTIAMTIMAPAQAQWVVTDPALQAEVTANQATEITNQGTQITKMIEQYQQMITQYTAMLSSIGSLQNIGLSAINNSQLAIINDPAPYVQQSCPNATDPVHAVVGALGLSTVSFSGRIRDSQNTICQNIAILEIHKYNTIAQMINEMNSYFSTISNINARADAIIGAVTNAVGDRQAVSNQMQTAQTMFGTKYANVQQELAADDAAIAALKAQQSILGNIALKGSNSLIGNAMATVVFAGALQVAE